MCGCEKNITGKQAERDAEIQRSRLASFSLVLRVGERGERLQELKCSSATKADFISVSPGIREELIFYIRY